MRILIFILFACHGLGAQKVVEKSLISPETSFVKIDATDCFQIFMDTADANDITVEATIDGEYEKDLSIHIRNMGSTTLVSTGFRPNFVRPTDKLSAHKVISISLKITLPKNKNVKLYGAGCNVYVAGTYRFLQVTLNDGKCILNNVSETAEIVTQSGDISVRSPMAEISARSKYGHVDESEIPNGDNRFVLRTITGDIHLKKTE